MASILFVDDDPFTLETLAKATEVLGHEAILANTGQ
jgi:CheY-like chemotaxis protein